MGYYEQRERYASDTLHCLARNVMYYANVMERGILGLNEALLSDNIVFTRPVGTNGKIDRIERNDLSARACRTSRRGEPRANVGSESVNAIRRQSPLRRPRGPRYRTASPMIYDGLDFIAR